MLQELAAQTGAGAFVIGAMFFFMAVWFGVFVRVLRTDTSVLESRARMPLDDAPGREPQPHADAADADTTQTTALSRDNHAAACSSRG